MGITIYYSMGNSNSRRILRQDRLTKGLCMYCGEHPFLKDRKGCLQCLDKCSKTTSRYCKNNRHKLKAYHTKIRQEVLIKYGGKCRCCGEANWKFLTIDHVNQDGGKERRNLYGSQNGSSSAWFLKLRREPIRDDLRVLCYNCNMAVFQFGSCPHEQRKENCSTSVS